MRAGALLIEAKTTRAMSWLPKELRAITKELKGLA